MIKNTSLINELKLWCTVEIEIERKKGIKWNINLIRSLFFGLGKESRKINISSVVYDIYER